MAIAAWMLLFWLGFSRFDYRREIRPVSKKTWNRLEKQERRLVHQHLNGA